VYYKNAFDFFFCDLGFQLYHQN